MYRFNMISVKVPAVIFADINKQILKFIGNGKQTRTANGILGGNTR